MSGKCEWAVVVLGFARAGGVYAQRAGMRAATAVAWAKWKMAWWCAVAAVNVKSKQMVRFCAILA